MPPDEPFPHQPLRPVLEVTSCLTRISRPVTRRGAIMVFRSQCQSLVRDGGNVRLDTRLRMELRFTAVNKRLESESV